MSKKKKKKEKKVENTTINFGDWFYFKVNEGKLKPWQLAEISIFFEHHGLGMQAKPEEYDKILEKY